MRFEDVEELSQHLDFVHVKRRHTLAEYGVLMPRDVLFATLEPHGQVGGLALFNGFTQLFGQGAWTTIASHDDLDLSTGTVSLPLVLRVYTA